MTISQSAYRYLLKRDIKKGRHRSRKLSYQKTSTRKKPRHIPEERDFPTITKLSKELFFKPVLKPYRRLTRPTRIANDLRRWNPDKKTPLKQDGTTAKISLKKQDHWLSFDDPLRTTICIRRKARRLSLFMRGKIGKGRSVKEQRKTTHFSSIKC